MNCVIGKLLKGNKPVFPMFLHKSVRHGSLPYSTIRAVPILASNSWIYSYLKNDSRYQQYGESATPRINDTQSRWLPASLIQWVADSPHQWYGESPTPSILDSGSRQLRVLQIRRVDDSAYRWVGESLSDKISTIGNGWDLAECGWDLAECGWDLAELWMSSSRVWMSSSRIVDVELP